MSTSPERPALPLIIVHAEAAAGARRRVSDLLEAAGARPEEVQHLLAVIEAGAVEGAHRPRNQPGTGSSGRTWAHSASVMSEGYRRTRSG
jgi:hypothetical protein